MHVGPPLPVSATGVPRDRAIKPNGLRRIEATRTLRNLRAPPKSRSRSRDITAELVAARHGNEQKRVHATPGSAGTTRAQAPETRGRDCAHHHQPHGAVNYSAS